MEKCKECKKDIESPNVDGNNISVYQIRKGYIYKVGIGNLINTDFACEEELYFLCEDCFHKLENNPKQTEISPNPFEDLGFTEDLGYVMLYPISLFQNNRQIINDFNHQFINYNFTGYLFFNKKLPRDKMYVFYEKKK